MPLRSSTAAAGDSDADILLPDATVHSASSDTDSDRVQTLVQGLTEQLRQARDQAQAHLGELKVQSSYYQEQLATANHDMGFFRASASEKEKQARQLQNRCLTLESQNEHLDLENADLRRNCNSLKQQQQQTSQELADTQQKHDYEIARNQELQEQVHMLTRCLDEEAVRKSGDCTVLIAFDNQQRQQQYRHAVRTFLQPIEDKFVLDVDVVQKPKACKFLLYVTYSSTVRLVNFDTAAFEDFKQGCPTENAVVLVIHRNQSDDPAVDQILKAPSILSGLHLGKDSEALHVLQLSACGSVNQSAELLSNSEVNRQNQALLLKLLQLVLPLNERMPKNIWQRIFNR